MTSNVFASLVASASVIDQLLPMYTGAKRPMMPAGGSAGDWKEVSWPMRLGFASAGRTVPWLNSAAAARCTDTAGASTAAAHAITAHASDVSERRRLRRGARVRSLPENA